MNESEQLIVCLEGEIAKRDARIVELERAGKNDAIAYKAVLERQDELRAELAALKAQKPVQVDYVAVMRADGDGGLEVEWLLEGGTAELMNGMYLCCVGGGTLLFEEGSGHLYAAPVSEVKAQGVVMPEPMKRGDEGGSGEYGAAMIRGYNACLREVARLNAAPAAPAADAPPENCRQRLAAEGKPYPRYSCAVCGKFSPKLRECDAALAAHRAKGVV